jgi:hypothetical protein
LDPKTNHALTGVGMHVSIALLLESGEDRLEFDIVPDESADFARGFLGQGTRLAQAILGQPAGAEVPYAADDVHTVRILAVSPAQSAPPQDVQARRQAVIRKAVDQSDRTNAVIFASSFSGKWGDYDPTGFLNEEEEEDPDQKP